MVRNLNAPEFEDNNENVIIPDNALPGYEITTVEATDDDREVGVVIRQISDLVTGT